MAWGFQSWDANGKPNNYGIVPISVAGVFKLTSGQQSGSYSYSVPDGYALQFAVGFTPANYTAKRRRINISGNSIVITSAADSSMGGDVYQADVADVIVYMVKA